MKPLPLFGTGIQSYSAVATAQRRLNCFYDPRSDQDKNVAILRGTPGSTVWITLPTSPIRGWWPVHDILYVVAGAVLYSVTTGGTITSLGNLSTSQGRVEIKDNGTQLCIVDGTFGYYLTIAGSVFAKITDVNFPNGATTVAFLNGRFTVNNAGTRQAYVGQIYDATSWTPATFMTKENESSNILAVEVLNGMMVLWGTLSIEFWQDLGSIPLPYQRISGATQSWGLAAVASRVPFGNSEIFLGQNQAGHLQILILNGYVPQPISTTDIDTIIGDFSVFSDAIALSYSTDGHEMYQITFPTGGRSFLYDGLTGLWSETQTGVALLAPHFGNLGVLFNLSNYMSDTTTGIIYKQSSSIYTDNGVPIKRQARTRHIRNGGNIFSVSEMYLDMETGVGTQSGQGSNPMLMVQVSKDGGRTFGLERQVPVGKIGQYMARVITRRWGQARDIVWQFTLTDPIPFLICGGSLTISGEEGKTDAA